MASDTMVNLKTIEGMVMANLHGLTAESIMVAGKLANNTVMAPLLLRMELRKKVSGKTARG
jgi:hypothetical protein